MGIERSSRAAADLQGSASCELSSGVDGAVPSSVRFPAAWCATDLGDYRLCRATYERYPYDSVPPLEDRQFTGSFEWFGDPGAIVPEQVTRMNALAQKLSDLGMALPPDFITFQTHDRLNGMLDEVSVTCCWSDVSRPMESPVEPGAYLVRFLRDQQDCVLWYLYLRPSGETFVVHSYDLAYHLDYLDPDEGCDEENGAPELDIDALKAEIFWCAPTFEQFAYRFWLENRLWCLLHQPDHEVDETQRRYLDHYGR